jgi:hypothetical protein
MTTSTHITLAYNMTTHMHAWFAHTYTTHADAHSFFARTHSCMHALAHPHPHARTSAQATAGAPYTVTSYVC